MRILLVEETLAMQRLLKRILELNGHEVLVAGSGEEAWEAFQRNPVRMVITEWMMPGLSGLDLCLRIRSAEATRYTYVIIMTAQCEKACVAQALAAGADDFVAKPIDRTELRWRLQSGLRVLNLEDNLARRIQEIEQARQRIETTSRRIRCELAAAARAQRALLPSVPPRCRNTQCAWYYRACDELGGDSLNLMTLGTDKIGMYVLDVSGHGVPAALLAVTLHRTLTPIPGQPSMLTMLPADHSQPLGMRPADLLTALNRQYPMDLETGQYFTMIYGFLDGQSGLFRYSTAGHPVPVLIPREGEPRLLPGAGPPVGFEDQPDYEQHSVQLQPGDRVCLYSDGITEVRNADRQAFSDQGLMHSLGQTRDLAVHDSLARLLKNVRRWAGDERIKDDVSAVIVEYAGPPAQPVIESQASGSRHKYEVLFAGAEKLR